MHVPLPPLALLVAALFPFLPPRAREDSCATAGSPREVGDPAAFARGLDGCAARMHHAMAAARRADSGAGPRPVDEAFVAAMIPHHQGAIDMARLYLLHGRDSALRALALGVVAEQQAEVALMRARLARRPAGDRVYTADQVSNTVSVIDPAGDTLVGQLRLGNARPAVLSPLYSGQLNVHGLGASPDARTLVVVSTGSNGVTFVETASHRVLGTTYVGRSPHEPTFTPDGREVWVTVRGEDHVAVLDPRTRRVTRRIATAPGPGMVAFRPDGRVAFVAHSFTAELHVVDVATGRRLRTVPVTSPFSPNLAVTPDGSQVWLTHKDAGKVTVVDARTFAVVDVIDTGPVTNHVTFALGRAWVTVGGEDAVEAYTLDRRLVARVPVGPVPHGIWPSADGTKLYVGLQQGDAVAVLDARAARVTGRIAVGQSPQAVVYVAGAAGGGTVSGPTSALEPLGRLREPVTVRLLPAAGAPAARSASATVTLRALGPVDGIDLAAAGLAPGVEHALVVAACDAGHAGDTAADADGATLATFHTDARGAAMLEAIGPERATPAAGATSRATPARCLTIRARAADGARTVLTAPLVAAPTP